MNEGLPKENDSADDIPTTITESKTNIYATISWSIAIVYIPSIFIHEFFGNLYSQRLKIFGPSPISIFVHIILFLPVIGIGAGVLGVGSKNRRILSALGIFINIVLFVGVFLYFLTYDD